MKYIVTERVAVITSGVLQLTDDQAKHRMANLKQLGKGRYEVTGQVQFKYGEEFGYDGDLPKALAENLTAKEAVDAAARKAAQDAGKAAAEAEKSAARASVESEKARAKAAIEAEKSAAKHAEEEAKTRARIEADAHAEWKSNHLLREQYGNNFSAYLEELLTQPD